MNAHVLSHNFKLETGAGEEFSQTPSVYKSIGFRVEGNALVDGLTVTCATFSDGKKVTLPINQTPIKMFSAKTEYGERIYVHLQSNSTKEGTVWVLNLDNPNDGFAQIEGITCDIAYFCSAKYLGVSAVVIATDDGRLFVHDGESVSDGLCPTGAKGVLYYNQRLVVLTESYLYTSNEHIMDFDYAEENTYALPEEFFARSIVACGDGLIIAGNRGLARMYRMGYSTLMLKTLCVGAERYFPNTLVATNEGFYILGENGLTYYNGADIRVKFPESVKSVTDGICAYIRNGEYHVSVKTADIAQKRGVLSFNEEGFYFTDTPIITTAVANQGKDIYLLSENTNVICTFGGGYVAPMPTRRYLTATTNFGVDGVKAISSFSVCTNKPITLKITADGVSRSWKIRASRKGGKSTVYPYIRGREFCFEIIYEGVGCRIYMPTVTYEVC